MEELGEKHIIGIPFTACEYKFLTLYLAISFPTSGAPSSNACSPDDNCDGKITL